MLHYLSAQYEMYGTAHVHKFHVYVIWTTLYEMTRCPCSCMIYNEEMNTQIQGRTVQSTDQDNFNSIDLFVYWKALLTGKCSSFVLGFRGCYASNTYMYITIYTWP